MKRRWQIVFWLLSGCGPVLLGKEESEPDAAAALALRLHVRPDGCGCFALQAEPDQGKPPYQIRWSDGGEGPEHRVCFQGDGAISVTVRDADDRQGELHATLEPSDAGCPPPPTLLCLENGSFEGTPAPNTGLPPMFDAPPWSACTSTGASNTPDIVNHTIPQIIVKPVPPSDGNTFLALGEDEQASQALCEPVQPGTPLFVQLDVARVIVTAETEKIWLEIAGGLAADCSARELLWASAPLEVGWKTLCVPLMPSSYMDNLVLRAVSDKSQLGLSYLLVDHMVPVASCP